MPARLDLFELATRNGPSLEARCESELGSMTDAARSTVNSFTAEVRGSGKISINRRLMDFRRELERDRFDNLHDIADARARFSSKSKGEIMRGENPGFHEKRTGFNSTFQDEEEFLYGAFNMGGLGAQGYGEFCVIVSPERLPASHAVAYLRNDSLQRYVGTTGAVDVPKLSEECAAEEHKHHLCILKHLDKIENCAPAKWFALVCNRDDYLEAIVKGELSCAHVTAVRLSRFDYELYFQYAFDEIRRGLSELDRYKAADFQCIFELLDQRGVPWEPIPDA